MKFYKYIRKAWLGLYFAILKLWLAVTPGQTSTRGISPPAIQGEMPVDLDASLLFYAAADSRYFDTYGRSFLGSMINSQASPCVHIHLFNPRTEQLDYLQRLKHSDERLQLSYTWEEVDLGPLPLPRRGRYYYSVRFVRMAEVAKQARLNCLCLDIDALLVQPAEQLLAELQDCDIAFYSRFERFGIDTKLLAGTLFVAHADLPRRLLTVIGDRIRRFLSRGQILKKLDQIVIYDAFRKFKRRHPELRFKPFDDHLIDTCFSSTGVIWYPKGVSKHDTLYEEKRLQLSCIMGPAQR